MSVISTFARAHKIAQHYAALPQVEAVALAGSQTSGVADENSDIDLYVYLNAELPLAARDEIAQAHARQAEVGNQFWESGDEWIDANTGIQVDVMFRSCAWIEEQLDRVLVRHEASVGYSTCFWHNVTSSQMLFDRNAWFQNLQKQAAQPFPEALQRAIIAKNFPILRRTLSSYHHQIERAVSRNDEVSVNHRVAALLASYFDILFAVNRVPHPGEKRLMAFAQNNCKLLPKGMDAQLRALLRACALGQDVLQCIDMLLEGLEALLRSEQLLFEK